jgi:endonuclease-3
MKTSAEARAVLETLEGQHPNADTELDYRNPFELLVATILSAQTTDVRVNLVTPALFARFPDARTLAATDPAALEGLIRQTGFFRQKARALLGMSQALVARHGGEVPSSMDALVTLPGVGRKTANVVLGHALGVPGLPVDRHVLRVTNRIGLVSSEDPDEVERRLCELLPREKWTLASDTFILHGRRVCKPKPECDRCAVRDACGAGRTFARSATGGRKTGGRKTASGRSASHQSPAPKAAPPNARRAAPARRRSKS